MDTDYRFLRSEDAPLLLDFMKAIASETDNEGQGHEHQGKIFRGTKFEGEICQRRSEEAQTYDAQRTGHTGGNGADGQSGAAASLLRQLETVDGGAYGGSFTGNVHHDGRGGPPVHGTVINGCQHDDGAGGVAELRGQGQQDGYAAGGTYAGQNTDQGSEQTADHRQEDIEGRQGC